MEAKSRVAHTAETISDCRRFAYAGLQKGRSRSRAGSVQTLLTHRGRRLPTHPCTATKPGASMEWMITLLSLGMLFQFSMRRSEEHTSELQSLMRISYAVFCLKKKKKHSQQPEN